MTREGTRLYAIRTPTGWWRRGYGPRKGAAQKHLKWATLYRNKGAATTAAMHVQGQSEIVEMLLVVGDVVFRCESCIAPTQPAHMA